MQIRFKLNKNFSKDGFTMVEIVFVIFMIAILAGAATLQYIDFRDEAKDVSIQSMLGAIRTAISNANNSLVLKCGADNTAIINRATLLSNDLTTMAQCDASEFTDASDRKVLEYSNFPVNPINGLSTIGNCAGAGRPADCADGGSGNFFESGYGWCYNSQGDFFAAIESVCSY